MLNNMNGSPYPCTYTHRAFQVRSGWMWGWALLRAMFYIERRQIWKWPDANRRLRAVQNWACRRGDTVTFNWNFNRGVVPSSTVLMFLFGLLIGWVDFIVRSAWIEDLWCSFCILHHTLWNVKCNSIFNILLFGILIMCNKFWIKHGAVCYLF